VGLNIFPPRLSKAANVMVLEISEIVDYMGCHTGLQPIYIQHVFLFLSVGVTASFLDAKKYNAWPKPFFTHAQKYYATNTIQCKLRSNRDQMERKYRFKSKYTTNMINLEQCNKLKCDKII
jgi:hypothetical protein